MEPSPPPKSEVGRASLPAAESVELGRVIGVFGFRGELRVHLHNPGSDFLREPRTVVLVAPDGARRAARLQVRPGSGQRILGKVDGVDDEAGARALDGHRITVATADLPALPDGEYYVWQLEGAEVRIDGVAVGRVGEVQPAGPHDVLRVDLPDGEPRFVPLLAEFVARVDAEHAVVELVPGALEEG
jgi:16S rRNA processing protein RimM